MSRPPARRGPKRDPIRDLLDSCALSGARPSAADIAAAIPEGTENLSVMRRRLAAAAEDVARIKREGRNADARREARDQEVVLLRDLGDSRPPEPDATDGITDPRELARIVGRQGIQA